MKLSQSIALSALAAAWLIAMPADAATQQRVASTPGARLCTLSIPTTDTGVRPKATGFRNEGKTSAFVICTFDSPPGQNGIHAAEASSDPSIVYLFFSSIDGHAHTFDCTGVNSWSGATGVSTAPMQYVVKTATVDPAFDPTSLFAWQPADFGGGSHITTSGSFSVTCKLPPGTAITLGTLIAVEDVGS